MVLSPGSEHTGEKQLPNLGSWEYHPHLEKRVVRLPPLEHEKNISVDPTWQQRIDITPPRASICASTGPISVCGHEWQDVTPVTTFLIPKEANSSLGNSFPLYIKILEWSE